MSVIYADKAIWYQWRERVCQTLTQLCRAAAQPKLFKRILSNARRSVIALGHSARHYPWVAFHVLEDINSYSS